MQGILNLDSDHIDGTDDFIVSYSNFEAYNGILNWDKWQNNRLLIIGPHKSGKTLLSTIWQKNTDATIISDVENIDDLERIIVDDLESFSESSLVNIINLANEKALPLLLTASQYPSFTLKDLSSRIKATYKIVIKDPDEELLKLLIMKSFKQKQITVSDDIVDFIFSNIERSYESAYAAVDLIDKLSKITKRNITLLFVKEALINYCQINAQ
jgi:chromosomal replication initiation ATPase DnaA